MLLLSQLLDEDCDSRCLCSYFLDEGVVVLPLWLQTHLKHTSNADSADTGEQAQSVDRRLLEELHMTIWFQSCTTKIEHII